jgi:Fe-S-cluster-containing hydrogenase component 2
MGGGILKDDIILQVRKDLCVGCGLCAESCPQQAISLQAGQAKIYRNRCNRCGICLDVCPRGAIVEVEPVSVPELQSSVAALMGRAEVIIARIEKLAERKT